MNLPLVSIAMATYNGEKFVEQQIQSLLAQDYPNLEIVISDDCSQDRTWEILEHYASIDDRIRLLPRTVNLGYVKNFVRVFSECKGELISPCDQDDIWYPNKTSRLVEEMGDATLIYCNNRYIDEKNSFLGKTHADVVNMIDGQDVRKLLFCTSISGHTMIFNKKLLSITSQLVDFPYVDWAIAFLAAEYGNIKYLDEILVDWRQHSNSATFHMRSKTVSSKARIIKTDMRMLELFSLLESSHKEFIKEAYIAYSHWFNHYFSITILVFIFKNGHITHFAHPAKNPYLKYILGYKLKKTLHSKYY